MPAWPSLIGLINDIQKFPRRYDEWLLREMLQIPGYKICVIRLPVHNNLVEWKVLPVRQYFICCCRMNTCAAVLLWKKPVSQLLILKNGIYLFGVLRYTPPEFPR